MSSIAVESFGVGWEGTIHFDWHPNPRLVANNLAALASRLNDMKIPLTASRQILAADIRQRFDEKTDPEGLEWTPWADSYAARAEQENIDGLMVKTGELRDTASDPSTFAVIDTEMTHFVGTIVRKMPKYWIYHQQPDGPSERLPQRAFIGLSDKAALDVALTFDNWFDEELTLFGVT